MLFLVFIYSLTIATALLYVSTLPWQWHTPGNHAVSWWTWSLVFARIIFAGMYLALLLLYLPTIHFIINMILFTLVVGIYMSYKLARN